jgi:hypothetical protein
MDQLLLLKERWMDLGVNQEFLERERERERERKRRLPTAAAAAAIY